MMYLFTAPSGGQVLMFGVLLGLCMWAVFAFIDYLARRRKSKSKCYI